MQKAKEAVQDSEVQLPNATFCRNFLQDPSGDPSDTSTGGGAVPPDVSCNDHNVRVESSAQANGSGGPLLQPSARVALHSNRSCSLFEMNYVHFRPASWPKGGDISEIEQMNSARPHSMSPFQRPVEGETSPPPRPNPGRPKPCSLLRCLGRLQTVPRQPGASFPFDKPVEVSRKTTESTLAGNSKAREEHSRNEAQDHWERLVLTELGDTSKRVTNLTQSRHLNLHIRQSVAGAAAGTPCKYLQPWTSWSQWTLEYGIHLVSRHMRAWPTTCTR